ncbi:hypothetical protein Ddye_028765 [Dipteronia dyeriana]|uniref:Disease resistance N-terminal domain-containing protein n=1 Tax=Dipteronia dyeriana TaxID=168575 RepID=A0AAD9TDX2_9ROSI|nr:hypothetical protein Ddye_028765 [Dipteronia dyeriana]
MSVIREALLFVAITTLFDKLASTDLVQFGRQEQILAALKKWEIILRHTYIVLDDADERQIADRFVKDWLSKVRNLAYDVEDILDEFATEALRRKLVDQPQASNSSKVRVGGLGKTTLAQLVYNDVRVETQFDIKAWACISEDFDIARLSKTILQPVAPGTNDANDLNVLQVELRNKPVEKIFFIVWMTFGMRIMMNGQSFAVHLNLALLEVRLL